MRRALAVLVGGVVVAGCSFGGDPSASERVDRCVERLLQRADPEQLTPERRPFVERYARQTYCARFEQRGWVYEDGTISISSYRWAMGGRASECVVVAEPDGPPAGAPCPDAEQVAEDPMLDCALLHHVPREEVQAYLGTLPRRDELVCDDGTPLAELGAE
ncbi:MAG: hypothetical protein ICV64_00705 [Thermoleophilia bacterium]|nr:hypothetical protein [Thermoleophilia bacterium]